jgi:hypothetical protein
MGVDTTNWGEAQYEAAAAIVGLPASNFVPQSLRSIASGVAQNSVPAKAPATFVTACTASLICRGIIYFKSTPGDCGSPTGLDLEDAQLTGLAGSAVSAGLSTAARIAGAASGIAGIAGAALPGIGIAVQAITQIFANHAAAVANEQTTICKVALIINQVIPFYDSAVRRGLLSPTAAYSGMQNYLQQVIEQLDNIQKSCDAACVYIAILQAHYTFVEKYYPLIAPATAAPQAPGAPPAVPNTPPGQPASSGGGSGVAPVIDYYGNAVVVGPAFFATSAGSTVLPGVTGDYFTATELTGRNQWGLTPNSPISDGQYAQLVQEGAVPLKRASSGIGGFTAIDWLLIAAVMFVAFMLVSGKKLV